MSQSILRENLLRKNPLGYYHSLKFLEKPFQALRVVRHRSQMAEEFDYGENRKKVRGTESC